MQNYIVECRINGKEKIFVVNDTQKANITSAMGVGAKSITVNGETLRTECILLVSPFADWQRSDTSAQSSRNKYRCMNCFCVNENGNRCSCSVAKVSDLPTSTDYADTPERLRNGWIKCVKAAFETNPRLIERMKQKNAFATGLGKIIQDYAIAPEEVNLPTGTW